MSISGAAVEANGALRVRDNCLYESARIRQTDGLLPADPSRPKTEEMWMAKKAVTGGLSMERLRELARAGAEDTLKRLRAEVTAI